MQRQLAQEPRFPAMGSGGSARHGQYSSSVFSLLTPCAKYLPFKPAKIFTRILSRGPRFSVEEEEESSSSEDSRPLFGRQTSDVEDSSAASSAHLTPAVTRRTRSESPALNSSNQR